MRSPRTVTVVALAGAVALASAAYGIGTQVGGGTASARDEPDRAGPERGVRYFAPGFGGLADELGVEEDELRDALTDFREQRAGEHRDAFAAALAKALDKPVDEVEAALEAARPDARRGCGPFMSLRRLASELDVSRAELREALRDARPDGRPFDDARDELVAFLADRLGLPEDEVEEALPEPPDPPAGGPPGFGPRGWGGIPG
jgi:hypothetical protein